MLYNDSYKLCLQVLNERKLSYPLDVNGLIKSYGIPTIPYTVADMLYDLRPEQSSDRGFLCYSPEFDRHMLLFNEQMPEGTVRFTMLHELFHFLHGDIVDTKENDRLADCFARNLLAPAPLCNALGIKTQAGIQIYFGMSDKAAKVRLDLLKTDLYYIDSEKSWMDNIIYEPYLEYTKRPVRELAKNII